MKVQGRAWVVGDDIDTDQIYHGQYLPLTDPLEMAKHAMEYVPGMEHFGQEVRKGDVIFAGKNFGCGSSREHAVLCLKYSGVFAVVAQSFGRIFYRNAVNLGFPILECPHVRGFAETGDKIEVNLESGIIRNLTKNKEIAGIHPSGLEWEITQCGGLLNYLKNKG